MADPGQKLKVERRIFQVLGVWAMVQGQEGIQKSFFFLQRRPIYAELWWPFFSSIFPANVELNVAGLEIFLAHETP